MIKINQSFISKLDQPLFINGDSLEELRTISSASIDCIITSPPYFNLREDYFSSFKDFKSYILNCMSQCKRILKSSGSLWLNLGNYYDKGNLVLLSYIIATEMVSRKHWILVNDVIWRKTTSLPSSSKKRLNNTYEHMFHFVKSKDYYVNQEVFKTYKRKQNSKTSISGSLGKRYLRRITDSSYLTSIQKDNATKALKEVLKEVEDGITIDFRMMLKGENSVINGSKSSRSKEVNDKGFAILRYKDYSMLGDIWDITPNKEGIHESPFPEDLCLYPILATCPKGGVVLDPFCGSGTTSLVATKNKRKSIGIDIKSEYIDLCNKRVK